MPAHVNVVQAPTKKLKMLKRAVYVKREDIPINPFKHHANRAMRVDGRMKLASPPVTNVKSAWPGHGQMNRVSVQRLSAKVA